MPSLINRDFSSAVRRSSRDSWLTDLLCDLSLSWSYSNTSGLGCQAHCKWLILLEISADVESAAARLLPLPTPHTRLEIENVLRLRQILLELVLIVGRDHALDPSDQCVCDLCQGAVSFGVLEYLLRRTMTARFSRGIPQGPSPMLSYPAVFRWSRCPPPHIRISVHRHSRGSCPSSTNQYRCPGLSAR